MAGANEAVVHAVRNLLHIRLHTVQTLSEICNGALTDGLNRWRVCTRVTAGRWAGDRLSVTVCRP